MKKTYATLVLSVFYITSLYAQSDSTGSAIEIPDRVRTYIIGVISLGLFAFFYWVISKKKWKLLRDSGKPGVLAPYSLSRSQMAWWTFIVLTSLMFIWWDKGEMVEITNQMLILLGISAGTTVTANFIDNKDLEDENLKVRHQDSSSSNNFIMNIISDQSGPSIHRFQNVLFSIAIGVFVLYEVITLSEIPVLDENLMVLMGISSSTYLAIKNGENKAYQAEKNREETGSPKKPAPKGGD